MDLLDTPMKDFDALLAGNMTPDGFVRLNEINTALYFAGELLRTRGKNDTPMLGWVYKQESEAAASALESVAMRYKETGRFGWSGGERKALEDMSAALRQIIPALTRGELIEVLDEAADLVEQGMAA